MRKDLLITNGDLLIKFSLLIILLLMCATTTFAITDEDYTEIALGEDVTIVSGENFFKFTTSEAGCFVVATSDGSSKTVPQLYTDADHSASVSPDYYVGTTKSWANLLEYSLAANTTYYLYLDKSTSTSYTFQVNQDPAIMVTGITNGMGYTQEENTAINLSGSYATYNAKLTVSFNRVLDDWNTIATITAGGTIHEITISGNTLRNYGKGCNITVDLYNTLAELMADEMLKPNDSFTITLSDIKAAASGTIYGEDGTLTLTFLAPEKGPTVLKAEVVPENFLSYWRSDNEDGKIVITFNNELSTTKNTKNATISYGDNDAMGDSGSEDGDDDETVTNYTEISLPVTIDGKTATIDLTGVYRSFETLLPGATITEPVAVNVAFPILYDADGTSIKTGINGLSRFTYTLNGIVDVPTGSFSPAEGSLVASGSEVKLGLSHDLLDSYDGFSFVYTVDGEEKTSLVVASDITKTKEEGDSVTYSFVVPDDVAVASTTTVALSNPVWADGQTHDFSATYEIVANDIRSISVNDNQHFDIYTISGQQLMKNVSKLQLQTMKHGFYLINGKKVLLK